jgi:hypothetical protein
MTGRAPGPGPARKAWLRCCGWVLGTYPVPNRGPVLRFVHHVISRARAQDARVRVRVCSG